MHHFHRSLGGIRTRLVLAALVLGPLVALLPGDQAAAQEGQGRYLTQATQRLTRLIAKANQDGYFFEDNKFSAGGGWLTQDEQKWVALYTINLQEGRKYRFIAAGDTDARDVDLDVSDLDGKVLKSDPSTAPEAIVDFSPTVTQKYQVRIRLYASENRLPCFCLGVVMVQKQ